MNKKLYDLMDWEGIEGIVYSEEDQRWLSGTDLSAGCKASFFEVEEVRENDCYGTGR